MQRLPYFIAKRPSLQKHFTDMFYRALNENAIEPGSIILLHPEKYVQLFFMAAH